MMDLWQQILGFMDRGGFVLWYIAFTAMVIWLLSFERGIFFFGTAPKIIKKQANQWQDRKDKSSWFAHRIREMWISKHNSDIDRGLSLLTTLIAICPLLGLLGTVTGMIEVFFNMGSGDASNVKNMASGVSKATIPTMAGMVVALFGLLSKTILDAKAKKLKETYSNSLVIHHQ